MFGLVCVRVWVCVCVCDCADWVAVLCCMWCVLQNLSIYIYICSKYQYIFRVVSEFALNKVQLLSYKTRGDNFGTK